MYGAILGDIVGSPYEFDCNNYKAKEFPLFSQRSEFTDDTVMTLAVAKALLSSRGQDDDAIKAALVREMQQLGRAYPDRGYGTHFGGWLYEDDPQPYQSYGNGSAMRVSSAAWLAKDMAESLRLAHLTAQVSGGHQGRTGHCRGRFSRPHGSRKRENQGVCGARVWLRPQPNLRRNSSHLPSCRELPGNRAAGNHRVFGEPRF